MRTFQIKSQQYYTRPHSISYANPYNLNLSLNYQPNIQTIKVINPPQINKKIETLTPLVKTNIYTNGINPGIIKNYPTYSTTTKIITVPTYSNRTYLDNNGIKQLIKTKNIINSSQNSMNRIVFNPGTVNIVNGNMNPPNNINNAVSNQNIVRLINGNPITNTQNYTVTTITTNVGNNFPNPTLINSQSKNPSTIKIISTTKTQNYPNNPTQIQIQSQQVPNQRTYNFLPNVGMIPQNSPVPQPNLVNANITNIISNPLNISREPYDSINLSEFRALNQIGKGTFGKIYKVLWSVNNNVYALKKEVLKDMEGVHARQHRNQTIRNFIATTNCNGVVKIYGNLTIPNGPEFHYYELMELCDRDFEQEIKSRSSYNQFYTEREMYSIMLQLISTLSLLQKNHITHRDIKPQNILIKNGVYKLCDFGDIRFMQREGIVVQRVRGSELYMSPILFNGLRSKAIHVRHNTYKSDVFSLGMCFFLAGCLSYSGPVEIRELTDINQKLYVLNKYLSQRYSQKLIQILNLMLVTQEENRPDFIRLENAIRQYGL